MINVKTVKKNDDEKDIQISVEGFTSDIIYEAIYVIAHLHKMLNQHQPKNAKILLAVIREMLDNPNHPMWSVPGATNFTNVCVIPPDSQNGKG